MTAPKKLKETLTATVAAMGAAYGISAADAQAGCAAMFAEWEGRNTNALTNPEPLDRILTRDQVAEILACSKAAVTRKVKQGKLKAIYGGEVGARMTGVCESSLRAYMERAAR